MTVYLDANIVIYLVEADPNWLPRVQARLSASRLAGDQLAISDVHRLECLVGPLILGDAPVWLPTRPFSPTLRSSYCPLPLLLSHVPPRSGRLTASNRSTHYTWLPPWNTAVDDS